MFANAAFAQTGFAGLGFGYFPVSVTEALTVADSPTVNDAYFFTVTEAITVADSSTQRSTFGYTITEVLTVADTQVFHAQFQESITEALFVLDSSKVTGWFLINDVQTPLWGGKIVTITGYGMPGDFLLGMAPFAGSISNTTTINTPLGLTPVVTWTNVNDSETTSWILINNTQ